MTPKTKKRLSGINNLKKARLAILEAKQKKDDDSIPEVVQIKPPSDQKKKKKICKKTGSKRKKKGPLTDKEFLDYSYRLVQFTTEFKRLKQARPKEMLNSSEEDLNKISEMDLETKVFYENKAKFGVDDAVYGWDIIKAKYNPNAPKWNKVCVYRDALDNMDYSKVKLEKLWGLNAVKNRMNVREVFDCLVQRQDTDLCCNHITIGSSEILKLIEGTLDFFTIHQRFRGFDKNQIGNFGEFCFKDSNSVKEIQPKRRSNRFPFIVANADFILADEDETYVEVKSSTKNYMSSFFTKKNLIQVLCGMSIFQKQKGRIECYYRTEVNEGHILHNIIRINVIIKNDILENKIFQKKIISYYLSFFRGFAKIISLPLNEDDIKYFETRLFECLERKEDYFCPEKNPLKLNCKFFASKSLPKYVDLNDYIGESQNKEEQIKRLEHRLFLTAKCFYSNTAGASEKTLKAKTCNNNEPRNQLFYSLSTCPPDIYELVIDEGIIESILSPFSWNLPRLVRLN